MEFVHGVRQSINGIALQPESNGTVIATSNYDDIHGGGLVQIHDTRSGSNHGLLYDFI